ncbi:MAG: hypothetical protein R3343_01865 [Nitriliruptorales bacterium]|nr:hypothetical protein [Nitriliruptorales bacterium]
MRRFLLLTAALLLLTACGDTADPVTTEVDRRAAEFARLNTAVASVAETQASADPELADHLEAIRTFDALVEDLRAPDTVAAATDRFAPAAELLGVVDVDALRASDRELAFEVDDARAVLARARETAAGDWEARYLDAQDDVLTAVREYAEAADALAQVIGRYWDTYQAVAEETRTFVEQRWFYRTPQEAVDAYELAIDDHLPRLREARRVIADFTTERDEAAVAVNRATTDAAAVWASRPTDPSPRTTEGA